MTSSLRGFARIVFAWIFSLSGCIFQVYHISDVYFKYETVTQLTIMSPPNVIPPKVATCFPLEMTNDFIKTAEDLIYFVHVNDRHGYGDQEFNNYTGENVSNFISADYFYKRNHLCYSFEIANGSLPFEKQYITQGQECQRFFKIYMRPEQFESVKYLNLYLRPMDSFVEVDKENKSQLITMTYSTFYRKLMKYPYKTDCLNYSERGYESQHHCYDRCVFDNVVQKHQKIPFSVWSRDVNSSLARLNISEAALTYSIEGECKGQCKKPDCSITEHVPQVLSLSANRPLFGFEIYVSVNPDITTIFIPLITSIDYITFVLSCVGFWLGFSPLVFVTNLKVKRRKVVSIRKFFDKRHFLDNGFRLELEIRDRKIWALEDAFKRFQQQDRVKETSSFKSKSQTLFSQGPFADQVRLLDIKGQKRDQELRELRQFCKEILNRINCSTY